MSLFIYCPKRQSFALVTLTAQVVLRVGLLELITAN